MNKKEVLHELKELGIDASPEATYWELVKQLNEATRITPESKEEMAPVVAGDYLRQYQYRKGTLPGSVDSNPQPGSKAAIMKKRLLTQPKIRIFIPRTQGEDPSILQSVTLDNYRLDLPKNTYLDLPQQIAEVLMESLSQTEEAIRRNQIIGDKQKEAALL